jgi:uncharacterized protein (TIGR02391 family)
MSIFTQSQLEALAAALGDTDEGLTGTEIGNLLEVATIPDPTPGLTKRHRILNGLVASQNARQDRRAILKLLRQAMAPERYLRAPHRFEPLRAKVNRALAFAGLACDASGTLVAAEVVTTLPEAERRARELRSDLVRRGVHPDVLAFCRAELMVDDHFHAVLEAVKSVADKMRSRTGLTDDGSGLVDRALGGDLPMLAINSLQTQDEKSEQRGFANLVRGVMGMFRNTTAHAPRIHWAMSREDAEDLLSMVSLIHRRLDKATMPPRV